MLQFVKSASTLLVYIAKRTPNDHYNMRKELLSTVHITKGIKNWPDLELFQQKSKQALLKCKK